MMGERIDQHVAGAGVEGAVLRWLRIGGKNSDVSNAAKIKRHAGEFGVAIEKIVGVGNEGRALAAESDVRRAEVADGGDAGAGGDDGGFADLECRGGGPAQKSNGFPLVKDRLSVASDERNAARRDMKTAGGLRGRGTK